MKMQKIRASMLIVAICLFVGLSLSTFKPLRGQAETIENTATFKMENGAAVRIKTLYDENNNPVESNGIRFSAEITQSEYEILRGQGARFGMVIVAKDLLKGVEINENTVFGENPAFYFSNEATDSSGKIAMLNVANPSCRNIDEDENIEICGALVNIQTNNFTRSFIGRAYVALPQTDESGEITGYRYQFAPYYDNDVANNTRCIYYIAQRAMEKNSADASVLNEKYILPFSTTDRFTKYNYRYNVEHHYLLKDENGQEYDAYTVSQKFYGQLNSSVTVEPIEKPNVTELEGKNFIFDVSDEKTVRTGLVYAAGMQTLHLYYQQSADISEESKEETLAIMLTAFLDEKKAHENFGVDTSENGTWDAKSVTTDENGEKVVTGINLHTENPSKDQKVTLAKEFFQKLHAYGVETITFSFYSNKNGQTVSAYTMYKGDTSTEVAYEQVAGVNGRVKVKISELMVDGIVQYGLRLDIHSSASSNVGDYYFEDVQFGFVE